MWAVIGILVIVYLFAKFPQLKIIAFHPLLDIYYFFRDLFFYFWHKQYNNCVTGEMICFEGMFGKGKTLSAVHYVMSLYNQFNNKKVWDTQKKCFVTQKIHVISNVNLLQIEHYEHLQNLAQIVNQAQANKRIDEAEDTRTVLLVLIDEASVQLNSRSFKKNINADFLNTLLTSRHYHMSMFYTSQRFSLTDKLLRDVTQTVVNCKKFWRIQAQLFYDGYELENAGNPELVQPRSKGGFFVRNRDYNAYDTLAVVDNLQKSFDSNDFISDAEILELRNPRSGFDSMEEKPRGLIGRFRSKVNS